MNEAEGTGGARASKMSFNSPIRNPPLLPPELLYLIFEHADKKTLSSCSLIGRSWLDPARRYLFKSVSYHTYVHANDEGIADQTLPLLPLLEFLGKNPSICVHISVLSLGVMPAPPHPGSLRHYRLQRASLEVLDAIIRHIPNLKTFKICGLHFGHSSCPPTPPLAAGPAKEHLDSLYIDGRRSARYFMNRDRSALNLLSLFGSVGKLHLYPGGRLVREWLHRRTRVRELCLGHAIAVQKLSTIDLDNLDSFSLGSHHISDQEIPMLSELLAVAGHNLQHFTLPVYDILVISRTADGHLGPNPHKLTQLRLSLLQRLQSISFVVQFHILAVDLEVPDTCRLGLFPTVYAFIIHALCQLPDALHSITLELNNDEMHVLRPRAETMEVSLDDVVQLDWSELDAALVRRVIQQGLRSVRVTFPTWSPSSSRLADAKSFVERALPQTLAEGVLDVRV